MLAIVCSIVADVWLILEAWFGPFLVGPFYPVLWLLIALSGIMAALYTYTSAALSVAASGVAILHALGCLLLVWLDDRTFFGGAMVPVISCYAWLLVAFMFLFAAIVRRLTGPVLPRHSAQAVCRTCGYDLRGLPVRRCPECGRPFDVSEQDVSKGGRT